MKKLLFYLRFLKQAQFKAILALVGGLMLSFGQTSSALTLNSVDGVWQNARTSVGVPAWNCVFYVNSADTTDENVVTSGVGGFLPSDTCSPQADTSTQSGFGFQGAPSVNFEAGDAFLLGQFTHYNNPLHFHAGNMSQVELVINLDFSDPVISTTLNYTLLLEETNNVAGTCDYPSVTPCSDKVTFLNTIPDQLFAIDGEFFSLQIIGFLSGNLGTCQYDPDAQIVNAFISDERQANRGCLYARLLTAEPSLAITKTGTQGTVRIGDTVNYEITVSNTGLIDLTGVTLVDSMLGINQSIGDLSAGESVVVNTWHVITADDLPSPVVNTAIADSNETDLVSDSHSINVELPDIIINKTVDWAGVPVNQTEFFEVCITGASYPTGDCQTVDFDGGTMIWEDVIPDDYLVSETFSGTNWTSILSSPNPVTVAGDDVTLTVQNIRRLGSLSVTKTVNWGETLPDQNQSFRICIRGASYPDGNCVTMGATGGTWVWNNLIPDTYVVTEDPLSNEWTVSGSGANVQVISANTSFATITNTYASIPDVCTGRDLRVDLTGRIENQNVGYVTNISGEGCLYTFGMASYLMYDDIIDNQDLHNYVVQTMVIPAGETVSLTVTLPDCKAQVDLFYGDVLFSLDGQRYGDRLLDAYISDLEYCPPSTP